MSISFTNGGSIKDIEKRDRYFMTVYNIQSNKIFLHGDYKHIL